MPDDDANQVSSENSSTVDPNWNPDYFPTSVRPIVMFSLRLLAGVIILALIVYKISDFGDSEPAKPAAEKGIFGVEEGE